jgi:hypothetical protein
MSLITTAASYSKDARVAFLAKVAAPKDLAQVGLKGASRAVRRVRGGLVVAGLAVSIAVEGAIFARDAKDAYRLCREGKISQSDFRQHLAKSGCESVGGVMASTAGQLVIQCRSSEVSSGALLAI